MEFVAVVTVLALLQVFYFSFQVGQARVKHEVKAPAMSGSPEFERRFRVHQNTIEQLVILIPALWMFAYYVHSQVAAGLGLVFVIGRFIYRNSYVADPTSRTSGFLIGMVAMMVLLIGGLIGAIMSWL